MILLVAAACLFFIGLGRLPLLEPDEGRNAEVAREMLASGDWLTPHFDTLPYLDKPVVFFWLVAASFKVAGVTEYAARLPSALAGVGTVLLAWFLAKRMFAGGSGLRAGLVLATSPLVIIFARLVIFDMTLTFFVTLAMVAYWVRQSAGDSTSSPHSSLSVISSKAGIETLLDALMFASMGLGTLTKGPVGFILPLLSIVAFESARGTFGKLKRLRWGLGIGVFGVIVLPWFIAISLRHPDFPRYALWEESLLRFTTASAKRSGWLLYYMPVFLAGFFPWSLFLLFAAWHKLRKWKQLREEANWPALYLLCWSGVVFVFFTIARSKLAAYFLPATVPLAVLAASVWGELESDEAALSDQGKPRPPDWLTAGFAAIIAAGVLLAFGSRPAMIHYLIPARVAARLSKSMLELLPPMFLYAGLILAAFGIIGRNLASRLRPAPSMAGSQRERLAAWTLALLAFTSPAVFLRLRAPIARYAEDSSSRSLARTISISPQKDLPIVGYYYFRTSLPFYLGRPVGLVTADGGETTSQYVASRFRQLVTAAHSPDGGALMIDALELRRRANSPGGPFLVLVRNTHVSSLMGVAGPGGEVLPLWTEWRDSVWLIQKAGESSRAPGAGARN